MRLRAGLVICACGWSGELGWDAPCPACARPAIDRMNPARIAALRGVRDRDAPLDRMMRIRLIQIGVLRPAGKRPARGADGRIYRGTRNRSHVVTPPGLAALATADRLDAERRAAEQGRHDVAASVPTEATVTSEPIRSTTETSARRLCVRCGGGDAPEVLVAPAGRSGR